MSGESVSCLVPTFIHLDSKCGCFDLTFYQLTSLVAQGNCDSRNLNVEDLTQLYPGNCVNYDASVVVGGGGGGGGGHETG